MVLAIVFFVNDLYEVEEIPSYSLFAESCYHE